MRRKMQVPADRTGDWLRLVMIVKAREIAPAEIATQFDQTGTNHDAKTEPTEKPDHQNRRLTLRERPRVEQWTKEDRQETGLQQLDFPAVAVPNLADVNDRHVHGPKHRDQDCVRIASENNERQREADPGEDQ